MKHNLKTFPWEASTLEESYRWAKKFREELQQLKQKLNQQKTHHTANLVDNIQRNSMIEIIDEVLGITHAEK